MHVIKWRELCGHRISPIVWLTLAMSTLSERVEQGYFIAKQSFCINSCPCRSDNITLNGEILRKKQIRRGEYLICRGKVIKKNNVIMEIKSTLIRSNYEKTKLEEIIKDDLEFFRNIKKDEIQLFSNLSNDPNFIHKGEKPIVQGMLILLLLENFLALKKRGIKKGEIIYHKPIESEENIFLSNTSDSTIYGVVNNEKCFTINIEEEF